MNTPRSCFDACKEKFETQWPKKKNAATTMLTFNYMQKIGKRPDTSKWKGVESTREHTHPIMKTRKNLNVNVRDVVCLCTGCLHGGSPCKYSDYVDKWREFDMNTHKPSDVDLTLWKSLRFVNV